VIKVSYPNFYTIDLFYARRGLSFLGLNHTMGHGPWCDIVFGILYFPICTCGDNNPIFQESFPPKCKALLEEYVKVPVFLNLFFCFPRTGSISFQFPDQFQVFHRMPDVGRPYLRPPGQCVFFPPWSSYLNSCGS